MDASGSSELANVECGVLSRIVMELAPGAYTVVVEGYSSNEGAYTLSTSCGPPQSAQFRTVIYRNDPSDYNCTIRDSDDALLACAGWDCLVRFFIFYFFVLPSIYN